METILIFTLTNIVSFVAGAFLHRWLAKKALEVIGVPSKPQVGE